MKKALLLVIIVAVFFSCSNFVYYPNIANAPLLKSKDEIKLSAGLKGYAGYMTAAYALTDHIAFQAGSNLLYLDVTELGVEYKNGNLNGEVAAGIYFPFAKKLVAELYFGGGYGLSSSNNINDNILTQRNMGKIYIQGDIGFTSKYFNAGIALREVYVNAFKETVDGVVTGNSAADSFFESFIFIGLGPENHKINIQAGLSDAQFDVFYYAPFIVSLGYEYSFSLSK